VSNKTYKWRHEFSTKIVENYIINNFKTKKLNKKAEEILP
jgi:hypothetical protein